jgi:hypothetical protein
MSGRYTKPTLCAVAHHEAAHAVAHILLRLPGELKYIDADDQPPRGGHTEINRPPATPPTGAQAPDCILQQLVGAPAEFRIDGDGPGARSGADDDYDKAGGYARHFGVPDAWSDWEREAAMFVAAHWETIASVASALLAEPLRDHKLRLSADRIREIVAISDG